MDNDEVVGVVIAFHGQDEPDDVYVQGVVSHPNHRRRASPVRCWTPCAGRRSRGSATVSTSPPSPTNSRANIPGDRTINGVPVISNYKGPDTDHAVYELKIK